MKKIGLIGQFPPPLHGLSKALDTLYNSNLNKEYKFAKFDITNNSKFINNLIRIFNSNLDLYYLTISQSKFGNIRDLVILKVIQAKKKKCIIHLHGGGFRTLLDEEVGVLQRKINYKILRDVDKAIVLGESLKTIFKNIIVEHNIKVVKNCVDDEFVLSKFEFEEKMRVFKRKEELKILYLSNFIKEKGYMDVLDLAMYLKKKEEYRFKFIFAGKFFNKEDEKNFLGYIRDNKLEKIVEYKGTVYGKEKKELLRDSDYFILLTKYKNEGQPISIIEAASNGLRVITTDHAGILDILGYEDMIVCKKDNICVSKIYDNLNYEYNNRSKLANKLVENREKMNKEFSEKTYLESVNKIFKQVLDD